MTKEIFRSVDFWKSAVMMMPDSSFFELLRSVLGKIKTPFNKQQLLNDLEKFLLREDIQKTIAVYIDDSDAEIIAAVSLFREPFFRQLENFFRDKYSGAQLQDIIVNMEERFILYRFSDNTPVLAPHKNISYTGSRLALNPVLKTVLLPFTAETSALFPAETEKKDSSLSSAVNTCINDFIFAAIHSFILQWSVNFFKSEGVIRKRVIDEADIIFTGIEFEKIIGAFQVMGLYYADGSRLIPDYLFIDNFCGLSARERMEYFTASLIIFNELPFPAEILPPLFKNKLRIISGIIHKFIELLGEESIYPEKTFFRLIEVLKSNHEPQVSINLSSDVLFDVMEKTGLIIRSNSKTFRLSKIKSDSNNKRQSINTGTITIDSGFSVILYPEINFYDAVKLASVLNVREAGSFPQSTVIRFELVKDSAVRSFNSNISADDIIKFLNRLSNNKVNDNLIWNLKDWEKRYNEISLVKGIILKLSPDHRYLTETHPLDEMIIETLAPGIYLLNENLMDDAVSALYNAGIDIIAHLGKNETRNSRIGSSPQYMYSENKKDDVFFAFRHFPEISPQIENNIKIIKKNIDSDDEKNIKREKKQKTNISAQNEIFRNNVNTEKIKDDFYLTLEKMKLGDIEKNELSARINRKLILCDAQLKDAEIRYEKLEARHMDYSGKHNVAKTAISLGSPVEIVLSGKRNEERFFGIPQSLEKEGNDIFLIVNIVPAHHSEETESADNSVIIKRIPLAKISLLRRIKKSIFEN